MTDTEKVNCVIGHLVYYPLMIDEFIDIVLSMKLSEEEKFIVKPLIMELALLKSKMVYGISTDTLRTDEIFDLKRIKKKF